MAIFNIFIVVVIKGVDIKVGFNFIDLNKNGKFFLVKVVNREIMNRLLFIVMVIS